jgi:hypothetical protein
MDDPEALGRVLIVGGIVVAILGVVIVLAPNLPFLGRLPGDIRYENENVRVLIPFGTMILVSIVATIILNVIGRGR